MKDSGLRIRVERDLREQFLEVCRSQDKPAAQVLCESMRRYVSTHSDEHGSGYVAEKKVKRRRNRKKWKNSMLIGEIRDQIWNALPAVEVKTFDHVLSSMQGSTAA